MSEKYEDKDVLCASSAYNEKYYFNPKYDILPDEVKKELKIICVSFTKGCGGVFSISFDNDGNIALKAFANEYDAFYDEITAGLFVKKLEHEKGDLFKQLSDFYAVFKDNGLL